MNEPEKNTTTGEPQKPSIEQLRRGVRRSTPEEQKAITEMMREGIREFNRREKELLARKQ
jgi:hypothetical protein